MKWLAYGKIENLGNFLLKKLGVFLAILENLVILQPIL